MANPHNLKVGDTLWFVPAEHRGTQRRREITKVGRKFAYAGIIDIDLETLQYGRQTHGHPWEGQCWRSAEVYQEFQRVDFALHKLRVELQKLDDADYPTMEQIEKAAGLLGIPAEKLRRI